MYTPKFPARIDMTLINRPDIGPIVRQPPRPSPLIIPALEDKRAAFQILPRHIPLRLLQLRPHHAQSGSPTALRSQMRPSLDQTLHSVHVAD